MTNTPTDFEDYLSDKHADQYQGLDDEMGDDFNDWLGDQDVEDLITWGNEFAKIKAKEIASGAIMKAADGLISISVALKS